jgi:hypothetical protein
MKKRILQAIAQAALRLCPAAFESAFHRENSVRRLIRGFFRFSIDIWRRHSKIHLFTQEDAIVLWDSAVTELRPYMKEFWESPAAGLFHAQQMERQWSTCGPERSGWAEIHTIVTKSPHQ